ncbi:hypothetical protein BGZ70_003982, partial [Mortierella alpina]
AGARGALLSQIQSGIRLKKAVTKDKSVTKGVGRVMGEDSSAGPEDPSKGAAAETHIVSNSEQRPMGMPALGGLFAGGMPTLKKSPSVATGRLDAAADAYDSRRESTDWFGRLASHAPAENPPPTTSSAFISDIPVVPAATQAAQSIPRSEEPLPQAQQQQEPEAPIKVAEESLDDKVDFANGYRAKALWNYSAVAPDQVSLEADDFLRTFPSKEAGNVDWVYGVSEKDESIKGWLPKAYVQQVDDIVAETTEKFKAKVLFAYAAQNEGELSVQRGDIVEVMEKPDPQWWRAQSASGQTGVLPATYLEEYIEGQAPLVETPIAKAKVLYTYAGQTDEELSVDVGEEVDIMEKPDPLWWRVKSSRGDIGMLPATYLEELEGQSTSALDAVESGSEYESADDSSVEYPASDSNLDSDSDSDLDSDSELDSDTDSENTDAANMDAAATVPRRATPAIEIARASSSKHRPAPPRPAARSRTLNTPVLSTSAPSRPNALLRKQSEGSLSSHLSIPTGSASGSRQRSGSHSGAMTESQTHRGHNALTGALNRSASSSGGRSPSPSLLHAPSWVSSVETSVSQSLSGKEKKRQEAIHELITTEQVYLTYLYLVRDDFQQPLLDQGLISATESSTIFKEWSSLLELSQSIVDELTQRQESDQGVVLAVGDVINSHIVERAGCFMRYCANHREASVLLTRRMAESRLLMEFMKHAKSIPSCRGMDISSFLLQPLQRITRYPLLIKKILEYTEEDHIDHLLLTEALVSAESFLDRINEAIRSSETKQRLEEIQRRMPLGEMAEGVVLTSDTKYLGSRQILLEGHLRKAKSGRRLYGYLCNDLVLLFLPGRTPGALAKSPSHSSLSISASSSSLDVSSLSADRSGQRDGWTLYHAPIPVETLKVKADAQDDTKFTMLVTNTASLANAAQYSNVPSHLKSQSPSSAAQSMIHVKAGSAKERRAWLGALEKAIENLAKAPRGYGMRTSIRPPLAETMGTMTIRIHEGTLSSRDFGEQLFTTRPASTNNGFSGSFSILWRESVIFSVIKMSQVLDLKVMSSSPFSPDVFLGSAQVAFHTVVPFGERGTEVVVPIDQGLQVKLYMSYKAL